jgi:LPXTG-motif cell wall-anchored protein
MPVMRRRAITLLAAALLALGAPAAAIAQSAGDEQYQDPLAGSDPEPAGGSQGQTPPPPAQPQAAAPAQAAQPPAATPQLPRTGGREAVLAAAGFALLAGGLALRRRVVSGRI